MMNGERGLAAGTIVYDQYVIDSVLGEGGFGIADIFVLDLLLCDNVRSRVGDVFKVQQGDVAAAHALSYPLLLHFVPL